MIDETSFHNSCRVTDGCIGCHAHTIINYCIGKSVSVFSISSSSVNDFCQFFEKAKSAVKTPANHLLYLHNPNQNLILRIAVYMFLVS